MLTTRNRILALLLALAAPVFAQKPAALELLKQAEKCDDTGDTAAALKAYIDAVRIDPSVESLALIHRYQMPAILARTDEEKQHLKAAQALTNEALRMYVGRQPDDWEGLEPLVKSDLLVDRAADAEKVLRGFVESHPDKAAAHRLLVDVYSKEQKTAEALHEAEKLARIRSCEPKDAFLAGELALHQILSGYKEPSPARTRMLARAETNLRRAEETNPESFDVAILLNNLLYEEARTETNPERAAALNREREELRNRAMSIRERQQAITDPSSVSRNWNVLIRQGFLSYNPYVERTMRIKRAPFVIEVLEPDDRPIGLNVLGNDTVARRIHEGFRFPEDCKQVIAFCGGTGFAEEEQNPRKALMVAAAGFHYLYHDSDTDHRWSRIKRTPVGFVLQRDVAVIDDTPIEKTSYCRLFLTFLRRDDSGVLRADEVIRIVLQFD